MDGVSLNNPEIGGVDNSWGCGEQKFIWGYGEQKVVLMHLKNSSLLVFKWTSPSHWPIFTPCSKFPPSKNIRKSFIR